MCLLIIETMKKIDVFGIEMTSLQEMRFSKYLENNRIAMNTYYKDERKKIAEDWLNKYNNFILNSVYESNINDEQFILTRINIESVELHYKKDYPSGFVRVISKDSFFNFFYN